MHKRLSGDIMSCEECIYYEEHPFIREEKWDWCNLHNKKLCNGNGTCIDETNYEEAIL